MLGPGSSCSVLMGIGCRPIFRRTPLRRLLSTPTFPCVDQHAARESRLFRKVPASGPDPPYMRPSPSSYKVFHHPQPLPLTYSEPLPLFDIAYETWGTLSPAKDNVILLHTGLSASSHAASTPSNPSPGWWEKFIGPHKAIDTDQFFVICTNVLGGCYGSTGPSSFDPRTDKPYATTFPIISIFDMVRAQFKLLDHLGIDSLYASVGCSMGGMQSLAAGWMFPDRVQRVVSISGTGRTTPAAIAMRYSQRSVLMADPNWKNGFYYNSSPPHAGMKLARQIAMITYRSGPEWDIRFERKFKKTSPNGGHTPVLCPDFLIETYLDRQGEEWCLKYDANSFLYISKAMDLFDLTLPALKSLSLTPPPPRSEVLSHLGSSPSSSQSMSTSHSKSHPPPVHLPAHLPKLAAGLRPLADTPTLVLGVQSDILFTVEQQREVVDALRLAGNEQVRYYELGGVWGHDTFLLDVINVGGAIRGFLS